MKPRIIYILLLSITLVLSQISDETAEALEKSGMTTKSAVTSNVILTQASLEERVTSLEQKLQHPPKDIWDKLEAISGIISAAIIAIGGGLLTVLFNRARQKREEIRKQRELVVTQAETVEKFMPHLFQTEEQEKKISLEMISFIQPELGTKIAAMLSREGIKGAADALDKILKPRNAEVDILVKGGKTKQARPLIEKNLRTVEEALQINPEDAKLYTSKGYYLKDEYLSSKNLLPTKQRQEYLKRALQAFQKAKEIDPNNPSAHNGLGNVLLLQNKLDEAIKEFDIALELSNGDYPAAQHDKNLVIKIKNGEIPFDF